MRKRYSISKERMLEIKVILSEFLVKQDVDEETIPDADLIQLGISPSEFCEYLQFPEGEPQELRLPISNFLK